MKRIRITLAFSLMAIAVSSAFSVTDTSRPNILWISCEDMSPNLPSYGDNTAETPVLDKLATEGMRYSRAFATSPVCSASRSAIITGVYATTLGAQHHRSMVPLPPGITTFPTYLHNAGYYTSNNVKTDYNFPIPEHTWDESSNKAHWRNRPDKTQPFFSVFNFTVTHEGHVFQDEQQFQKETGDVPADKRVKPSEVKLPPYIPDTPTSRKDWARYYTMIEQMDLEVGKILKQLDEDGLSSNTLVVYFSDHGMGMPRGKRWLYDTGTQVPLIVRWPGQVKPHTVNEELATLMDLAPTMLSVAGIPVPKYMNGRVLFGKDKQPEPEVIYATRDRMDETHDMMRSVRDHNFKYIKNFFPEKPYMQVVKYAEQNFTLKEMRTMAKDGTLSGPATLYFGTRKPAEELYDVEKDPWEIHNLASDPAHADKLKAMRNRLDQWQKDTGDKGLEPENPDNDRDGPAKKRKNRK